MRLISLIPLPLFLCFSHFVLILAGYAVHGLLSLQLFSPLDFLFLLVVDIREEVYVLLLLPRGPDEVAVCPEALLAPILPPIALLED